MTNWEQLLPLLYALLGAFLDRRFKVWENVKSMSEAKPRSLSEEDKAWLADMLKGEKK